MSQESAVQPSKEEVKASTAAQPITEATKSASDAKPKQKGGAPKAVVKKGNAKADAANKGVPGTAAKKEIDEAPAQAPKAPSKAKKTVSPAAKADSAVAPGPAKGVKSKKQAPKKPKLVRDSFTIPENDYALFAALKQRSLVTGTEVKKSELVRAGLAMLAKLADAEFVQAIGQIERIKAGRPKK